MSNLINLNQTATMSSYDFLNDIINPARLEAGEKEVENRKFVARVEDEIDDLGAGKTFPRFGNAVKYYDLTIDQMMLVGMRESKAVRKNVLAKLKAMEINQASIPQSLPEALRLAADLVEENTRIVSTGNVHTVIATIRKGYKLFKYEEKFAIHRKAVLFVEKINEHPRLADQYLDKSKPVKLGQIDKLFSIK